ncbi:HEAT repeat domain-containing protein [Propionicimonas sp.]|uniref:HEAT repeat domain-containing protein n=1 Tax=Propionicimonas sp. TaxID=1955623 RepID=UPI0017A9DB2B|nr:HEAT repeat domain-containing protein [Propionicimonas sp.]MBU3977977.1 HEAT repeat domain-containing protein [Actinomycetota bacterium]MBA3021800.1 HEAT repeat domain-containing protein [Propionicimonas sp.]MBU3985421.1 HEAT repeat domain-containing protein [Actinomycetota bacterium]MBU4007516.1 HEAT repeat domain-containing protein [Actinomycetota bacterium]MBU4066590.1 HEAT repeat domain-containing protein [Actinomycetota bacterium]
MTQDGIEDVVDRLKAALQAEPASARLQTALAAGLRPNDRYIDPLVERFTVEPDFFVRDMLTWALIQHDPTLTLERVLPELSSVFPQARAQALHTLSKIGDQRAWPAITTELLTDAEDEVARTAWRAAATLVPDGEAAALAEVLATQFARGDRTTQRSLSRALAALGDVATPVIKKAKRRRNPAVRTHAIATEKLIKNPDAGFDVAIEAAQRIVALRGAPLVDHVAE